MDEAIIKSIKTFISTCPLIKNEKIRVDYLGSKPIEYSLDPVPAEKVIKSYINGVKECQFVFNFCSREFYSRQDAENIANSKFYEDFENWLESCNKNKTLPVLTGAKVATEVRANTSGYLYNTAEGLATAKYMIQCVLEYTEYKDKVGNEEDVPSL